MEDSDLAVGLQNDNTHHAAILKYQLEESAQDIQATDRRTGDRSGADVRSRVRRLRLRSGLARSMSVYLAAGALVIRVA
jgi:hypothetical protein